MIDDPLSLLSLGIWLLAAGMYPLGFMFGVCSACCEEECVCGDRDAVAASQAKEEADWCCSGQLPQEITVRVSNSVVGASDPTFSDFGDKITPKCEDVEGDYVLSLTSIPQSTCIYLYTPSCDFECPGKGEDDLPLPLFIPGIGIAAYAGTPAPGPLENTYIRTTLVDGPGFQFGISIFTSGGFFNDSGGDDEIEHCGVYFGVPAEVEDAISPPAGLSGATNGPEPVLIFGSVATSGMAFESSQCDMRGVFSGQAIGPPGYPGNIPEARSMAGFVTANASYRFAHPGIQSLDACDAIVSGSFEVGAGFPTNTWVLNGDQAYALGDSFGCAFDVEILAP